MKLRRYTIALLIAAGAGLLAFALTTLQLFEPSIGQLEYKTIDYRVRSSQKIHADSSDIRLVLFDSAFVASWPYLSPFPRAALASLIDAASQAGAKVIGLDVYLDRRYPELNALDSGDVKLRDAIRRAGNVVLVAPTVLDTVTNVRTLLSPDPYFADVAAAVSTADTPQPYDTYRDGVLTAETNTGLVPSFALALYAKARGIDLNSLVRRTEETRELNLPGLPRSYARLPEHGMQTVPLRFEGPPSATDRTDGAFKALSALAVSQLAAIPGAAAFLDVRDKVVLMGSGFHDSERYRTPFYDARRSDGQTFGWMYGVETHANMLQNVLSGDFIRQLHWIARLALAVAVAIAIAVVTFARGVKWGAAIGIGLSLGTAVVALIAFYRDALVVPIVGPSLASLFAFIGSTSYVSIVEGRDKRRIKDAFGKYLAPSVVEQLMDNPPKLGGDRRQISMLFSDLAGFTSMSEMLDPQKLVSVLNEYLHEMADLVKEEGGYVDKYIGDAVMALYGAPNPLPDHAARACRTALRMQRRLTALNEKWRADDASWKTLKVRIGLNTGDPVVGNIGGAEKIQYTALGDAVNLAARLEPACKSYGVGIMLAQQTRQEAGSDIQVRELDMLAVYGKKEPVRVYELLAMRGEPTSLSSELLEQYNKGLAAFRNRDFELALQYFKAAVELDERDGPSSL
ncbi:MAG: CHASE2 domain-containing protein [Gemmatimonadota bacterium]